MLITINVNDIDLPLDDDHYSITLDDQTTYMTTTDNITKDHDFS